MYSIFFILENIEETLDIEEKMIKFLKSEGLQLRPLRDGRKIMVYKES